MWTLTGELPVLWPASRPGQRVRSDSRPCLKRRRQLRAQCQLVAPAEYPISRSGKTGELGWGLADGKYLLGNSLGAGAYGLVHRGVDRHSGQEVAIKILAKTRRKSTREKTLKKIWKEAACLAAVQECNSVAALVDVMEDQDYAYLVLELCKGPDLEQVLEAHGPFPERAAAAVAYDTLKVISLCHDKAMVHGDVKPSNLMLLQRHADPLTAIASGSVAGGWLKAIDFGCAQAVQQRPLARRTGTPVFMAPEVFKRQYAYEADLWSLGITLYVLLAGRFPFWETIEDTKQRSLEEVMKAVLLEPVRFDLPALAALSRQGRAFLRALLTRDPGLRISAADALEHAWFREQFGAAAGAQLAQRNNIVPIGTQAPRCSFYNFTVPALSPARL